MRPTEEEMVELMERCAAILKKDGKPLYPDLPNGLIYYDLESLRIDFMPDAFWGDLTLRIWKGSDSDMVFKVTPRILGPDKQPIWIHVVRGIIWPKSLASYALAVLRKHTVLDDLAGVV